MDELDAQIVRLLQSDARLSYRELARQLGIAASTCSERVRSLERRRVIKGYHAEIDAVALNRGVQAMIAVQFRPLSREAIDSFQTAAAKMPEVLSIFVVAGGDDFLLHIGVPDLDALHAFLLDQLSKRREITGFRSSVVYQQLSNPTPALLGAS